MTLEILICTFNDGIKRAAQVPFEPTHNISYLVSWQQGEGYEPCQLPDELKRDDVKVIQVKGRGLSVNRNHALENATGDICLIADDDITYLPNHVVHVVEYFESRPTLDVASFKYASHANPKSYPSYSFDLRQKVKGYHLSSIEIAFRRTSVQGKLRFNELFGINAPVLGAGEESVFALDAVNMGLNWFFFPYVIARHEHPTTSMRDGDASAYLMSNGAYIYLAYKDGTALPRCVLFAWRTSHNPIKFFKALKAVFKGYAYIKEHASV